ncbi:hypothetical protein NBRC110019_12170 [Neptunitalea chrysea]|uniref:Uncharacterized protein n=1 Tax=Neptunitalea chrysea TaxID=1647581 RepID=A0A9W6EVZ1_9FLAO|nr:hypothetical protein [Neptunitalea chrysea]GLB52178.1 hypothetical protein NBRC110019_12170 [Neptunitalea chrysea]
MFCALSLSAQKGKLNKAKSKLNKTSESSGSGKSDKGRDGDDGDGSGGVQTELLVRSIELVFEGVCYVVGPAFFGEANWTDLNIYPYYDGVPGEYTGWVETDSLDGFSSDQVYEYKKSDLRANLNYFSGGSVNGFQTKIDFRPFFLVGIDVSYSHWYEDILEDNVELDIFSIMANYYRVRTKYVTGWWGLGYTRIANDVNKGGFAYRAGVDVFPVDPISFRMLFKQSFINETYLNELHV